MILNVNNIKNAKTLCIILAGYKSELWDKVFYRLYSEVSKCQEDIDVCICSSGVFDERLVNFANWYKWSYLSMTIVNNLCLAENSCIDMFKNAETIIKIDEDMFLTDQSLNKLLTHFRQVTELSGYIPSSIVPMINVNCLTYRTLLQRAGLLHDYETKFGQAIISNGLHHHVDVLTNPKIAEYLWKSIDIDDESILDKEFKPEVIGTRFSIGAVVFSREVWNEMKGFTVELDAIQQYKRIGLGTDEKDLNRFSMMKAKPMILDKTVLVGHLGYGPQTSYMTNLYKKGLLFD